MCLWFVCFFENHKKNKKQIKKQTNVCCTPEDEKDPLQKKIQPPPPRLPDPETPKGPESHRVSESESTRSLRAPESQTNRLPNSQAPRLPGLPSLRWRWEVGGAGSLCLLFLFGFPNKTNIRLSFLRVFSFVSKKTVQ